MRQLGTDRNGTEKKKNRGFFFLTSKPLTQRNESMTLNSNSFCSKQKKKERGKIKRKTKIKRKKIAFNK